MHLFLVEVNIVAATLMMSLVLKCENKAQAPSFLTHFLQTLVNNNWLTSTQ